MKAISLVDENGYFIEDVLVANSFEGTKQKDDGSGVMISHLVPNGFYKPRWDFVAKIWIEGMTAEEIEQINNPKPDPEAPETIEQKLHRLEQADLNNKELIATLYEMLLAK